LQIIDGLYFAVQLDLLDPTLPAGQKSSLNGFVARTRGFDPTLYQLYLQHGRAGLDRVLQLRDDLLSDKVGPDELRGFAAESGWQLVATAARLAIPTSGATDVPVVDVDKLLSRYVHAGDRRGDIPTSLHGELDRQLIALVRWRLAEGERLDPAGELDAIVQSLSRGLQSDAAEAALAAFIYALRQYVAAPTEQALTTARDAFYGYANHDDRIRSMAARIELLTDDPTGLDVLAELFTDPDRLKRVLSSAIAGTLKPAGNRTVRNPDHLRSTLVDNWRRAPTPEKKQRVIASALRHFDPASVHETLLAGGHPDGDLDPTLREAIEDFLRGRGPSMNREQLANGLFGLPLHVIRTERAKVERVDESEAAVDLEFRLVKGPGYGLWPLCAGVCVVGDMPLWHDPDFWLLAMIDRRSGQTVGFVQLYGKKIFGTRYLTVPGIEPSIELLSTVKTTQLYPMIEKALVQVADLGGFDVLVAPIRPDILSNRKDIQEIVAKHGYPTMTLRRTVWWNTVPRPYWFNRVHVLWRTDWRDADGRPVLHRNRVTHGKAASPGQHAGTNAAMHALVRLLSETVVRITRKAGESGRERAPPGSPGQALTVLSAAVLMSAVVRRLPDLTTVTQHAADVHLAAGVGGFGALLPRISGVGDRLKRWRSSWRSAMEPDVVDAGVAARNPQGDSGGALVGGGMAAVLAWASGGGPVLFARAAVAPTVRMTMLRPAEHRARAPPRRWLSWAQRLVPAFGLGAAVPPTPARHGHLTQLPGLRVFAPGGSRFRLTKVVLSLHAAPIGGGTGLGSISTRANDPPRPLHRLLELPHNPVVLAGGLAPLRWLALSADLGTVR
ncbi:MAG: hypothetical protein JWN44_7302, partial [Myxococcales bacterium]|nr:hypothetical protein [Myxococcales bacterium]